MIIKDEPKNLEYLISNIDGIIFIDKILNNTVFFDLFNRDGSRAEVSGNGLACLTYLLSKLLKYQEYILINSFFPNKVFYSKVLENEIIVGFDLSYVRVEEIIIASDKMYRLSIPNPHIVFPMFQSKEDRAIKKAEEIYNYFKKSINVHAFDVSRMYMYTFERGVGWTESCGSGAIACAYIYQNLLSNNTQHFVLTIRSQGGEIKITIENNTYWMSSNPQEIQEESISML